jgi:flagellar biosynthesis GTPase FlhF
VLAQPTDASAPLHTTDSIETSSHSEQAGSHYSVVPSQEQNLEATVQNNDGHTSTQHSEPHLDPQEVLVTKLHNPDAALTPNQSISLINYCATLGEQNAVQAADKEIVMVLGNAGAGKSTTVN